jgi:hypothetical protein
MRVGPLDWGSGHYPSRVPIFRDDCGVALAISGLFIDDITSPSHREEE